MLGEKSDGGMYAQEEIEIARASGERLIDVIASTELARRLMALQRERLAETNLLDRRARRVLHDDVLPQLHAAMLRPDRANELLAAAHHQISDLLREMPSSSDVASIGLGRALGRVVDDARDAFNAVSWDIAPEAEEKFSALAPMIAETVFFAAREAVRNAARHSRATHLTIRMAAEPGLTIQVEDDGIGPSGERIAPGGAGQGLALHSAMMAVIGGTLAVEPREGGGTRVTIRVNGTFLGNGNW
jgi:signal transduction histidine kinase